MQTEKQTFHVDCEWSTLRAEQRLRLLAQHFAFHSPCLDRLPKVVLRDRHGTAASSHKIGSRGESFVYSRLAESNTTRLILLQPGQPEDALKAQLKQVQSLRDHEYEALSYTWGEEAKPSSMLCSGKYISITANLDAALRQLRDLEKIRILWVDAICINQDDAHEKWQQIRNMREIYSSASRVIVWLGQESELDSRAIDCLKSVHNQMRGASPRTWALARLGWFRAASGRIFSGGAHSPMMTDIDYEHLVNLLRRPWFHRTWIIQEVATSERASVHCGDQSIPWEMLANVYMGLGERFLPIQQLGGYDAQHSLESITAIESARRSHRGSLSMSLYDILVATTRNQCKDDYDKVFAVLGLAKDWRDQPCLLPKYHSARGERAALETFKAFAVADVTKFKQLRCLSCASGPGHSMVSLPSWVPDWRYVNNSHPFTRYSHRSKFRASGTTQPEAWFSADRTILHVVGKQVDEVNLVVHDTAFTKTIGVFEITKRKISEIEQSYRWLQKCYGLARDGHDKMSAARYKEFCRTMTCGLTSEAFRAPTKYSKYFTTYLAFLRTAPKIFREYLNEAQRFEFGVRGLDEFDPHVNTHALIEGCLDRWASKRKFSVTRRGRLASIPATSREGDIICVLFGGEVPFVLRHLADGFHAVVGECYVDGIMDGQCLSDDISAPQEFRLK